MGKTAKWLRNFLTGKKDKKQSSSNQNSSASTGNPTTPILISPSTPKEKKRWSFRRSSATAAAAGGAPPKDSNSVEPISSTPPKMQPTLLDPEIEQRKHAMAMAAAADAAVAAAQADAAGGAAQAAADVILVSVSANRRSSAIEEAAAIKIQSVFRSFLARKALCALKGLVKLQALVRGHLVRKQATDTLRCMHALVTAQARARAQRMQMVEEEKRINQGHSVRRKSTQDNLFRRTYIDNDRGMEENIKIVEMDVGDSKESSKGRSSYSKQDSYQVSPAASALIDISPRVCSGHFEDHSLCTAQISPHYNSVFSKPDPSTRPCDFPRPEYVESVSYEYPFFPNYMANTESSRAKVRSQSAPKQRPDAFERQPSRRRASMEGRNVPRAVRMQRSSSHVTGTAQNYQYPWSIKLDRSAVSLKDSECGSTSTVLTNTNYCRSLALFLMFQSRVRKCFIEDLLPSPLSVSTSRFSFCICCFHSFCG